MLKKVKSKLSNKIGGRYAIVASKYNKKYVDSMVNGAVKTLKDSGADYVKIIRVPGAYEIPVVVSKLLGKTMDLSAVICLGVVIRGETAHAQLISESVTNALTMLQLKHNIPIAHEVLLLENETQAIKRCLDEKHNRGIEAAQTAIEMAKIMKSL